MTIRNIFRSFLYNLWPFGIIRGHFVVCFFPIWYVWTKTNLVTPHTSSRQASHQIVGDVTDTIFFSTRDAALLHSISITCTHPCMYICTYVCTMNHNHQYFSFLSVTGTSIYRRIRSHDPCAPKRRRYQYIGTPFQIASHFHMSMHASQSSFI
jgi:hypothetical protein